MKALSLLERIPDSRFIQPWLNARMLEASPYRTVYREGSLKVKIYEPHERPARAQVLLFPSLINRPYILDLGRGRSLIQAMLKSGIEVVMFDWGSPGPDERDMGLESFLEGRIFRALQVVHAASEFDENDSRPRTLLGHCLGGNLALLFAARQKKKVGGLRIDRLACLTTPIDTANDALLNTWFQIPQWSPEHFARSFQNIPWPLLQSSFQMLRPTMTPRRWIQFAQNLSDRDFRESWLQMEIWSNDCISFSSELFKDLLIPMYRDNAFAATNTKTAWREIGDLDLPLFSIAALDDHIVPHASAKAILQALPKARHHHHEARGGHIGSVLSKRVREKIWPELMSFITAERSAAATTSGARKVYRKTKAPRANPSRKSAATGAAVLAPEESLGHQGFVENLGARQSSAQAQT